MENKIPINRVGRFFSEDDFSLQINMGEEYLYGDLNMKLVLFSINPTKSDNDSVYAESGKDNLQFFPPIEFNGLARVEQPKNSTYKEGLVRYLEPGNLIISVYIKHLEELNADIKYGDFIGYPESENKIRYYTVIDDGKVVSDNKHSMFGYKPYYRTITCAIAQETEFRGI